MSLTGKVISITGSLAHPRAYYQELITQHGGTFSGSVTKKVTHLIVADPTANTTKIQKARASGTAIVDGEWLTRAVAEPGESPQAPPAPQTLKQKADSPGVVATPPQQPMKGFVIAINGRLSRPKEEYSHLITQNGGTFTTTVTKKTTHLVAQDADAASTKLAKARKYGTQIVSEDFIRHLKPLTAAAAAATVDDDTLVTKKTAPKLLLAEKFNPEKQNPVGYWVSEKLDGVRAYWDGEHFWSRLGNMFYANEEFAADMPRDCTLDGELFMGRGKFKETISIVKSHDRSGRWLDLHYVVFDVPSSGDLPFEERIELMRRHCGGRRFARMAEQVPFREGDDMHAMLKRIEGLGGEGLMLRQARSKYIGKRSKTLLKVKSFFDDEGKVIGYATEGKGRLAGTTGSLRVMDRKGIVFKVGSGMNDELRQNPPPIGSIITYRYQEKDKHSGRPRFPTYVGLAIDKEFPADVQPKE